MKVGLIDVDGHNFPNLPLMKISAWHKQQGDYVDKYDPMFGGWYDRIYMSKVFPGSMDYRQIIHADEIIKGGTGYSFPDGGDPLPYEIEHIYPNYELYHTNKAYGFLTRGCPMNCGFCIVTQKEGPISHKVADLSEFWDYQKEIVLLDANITACNDCDTLFQTLINSNAWIDFTQGLDIRRMNKERANMLNEMKVRMIHFAWDDYNQQTYNKLQEIRPYLKQRSRELRVYMLVNYNTTQEEDLHRVYLLKELGYDPFVMIYNKGTESKYLHMLSRWVNNKKVFYKCDYFENYMKGDY